MRADLLSSYDTLASHLVTTFSALSTALSQGASTSTDDQVSSRVYLAILTGPSLGAVKSRVFYGVDSFDTRVWGKREDLTSEDEDNWSGEEFPEASEDGDSDGDSNSDITGSHDVTADDNLDTVEDDGGHEVVERESEDDVSDEEVESEGLPSPSQHRSYAEEQRFLQTADRLLSRTLASADAEGHAISNEMCMFTRHPINPSSHNCESHHVPIAPSQTYILIRAPRRFTHPAWVPRQNITKQMESALADFLEESWPSLNNVRTKTKKKRVEGVWIAPRGGLGSATPEHQGETIQENDEMIWWSWDGKFIGFANW